MVVARLREAALPTPVNAALQAVIKQWQKRRLLDADAPRRGGIDTPVKTEFTLLPQAHFSPAADADGHVGLESGLGSVVERILHAALVMKYGATDPTADIDTLPKKPKSRPARRERTTPTSSERAARLLARRKKILPPQPLPPPTPAPSEEIGAPSTSAPPRVPADDDDHVDDALEGRAQTDEAWGPELDEDGAADPADAEEVQEVRRGTSDETVDHDATTGAAPIPVASAESNARTGTTTAGEDAKQLALGDALVAVDVQPAEFKGDGGAAGTANPETNAAAPVDDGVGAAGEAGGGEDTALAIASAAPKRRRGRPKKNADVQAAVAEASPPKRRRGRPKRSDAPVADSAAAAVLTTPPTDVPDTTEVTPSTIEIADPASTSPHSATAAVEASGGHPTLPVDGINIVPDAVNVDPPPPTMDPKSDVADDNEVAAVPLRQPPVNVRESSKQVLDALARFTRVNATPYNVSPAPRRRPGARDPSDLVESAIADACRKVDATSARTFNLASRTVVSAAPSWGAAAAIASIPSPSWAHTRGAAIAPLAGSSPYAPPRGARQPTGSPVASTEEVRRLLRQRSTQQADHSDSHGHRQRIVATPQAKPSPYTTTADTHALLRRLASRGAAVAPIERPLRDNDGDDDDGGRDGLRTLRSRRVQRTVEGQQLYDDLEAMLGIRPAAAAAGGSGGGAALSATVVGGGIDDFDDPLHDVLSGQAEQRRPAQDDGLFDLL
uniref:Uncharacterized protein n=1 Tax=Neobodo designis TaxID=312471 RepID=A0A7S1KYV7_NEODS|mmetsp:Transcript_11546/g.35877  ORF Transcript_11546/g.35877 Transcript_11546/m.35877 type:complete len:729 (+) Transcript_11546:257-2443(+)